MNKKLIAVAVASAVALPVVSAADVTVFGRVNNAITIKDSGGNSNTDVSTIGSRFGIKASSDVGNGLTASAKYEFATVTDKEESSGKERKPDGTVLEGGHIGQGDAIADIRIATVGLSGGFGSVTVGNQWSAFYDTVGTDIDPTYSLGWHLYSSVVGAPYRASNTIKYSNSFGPIYLEADVRINDGDEDGDVAEKINGNGYGIGVRIAATDNLTFAAAMDSEEDEMMGMTYDTDRLGVSSKVTAGNFYAMVGYHESEMEMMGGMTEERSQTQVWGGMSVGSTTLQLGFGQTDKMGNEPSQITLGVYHNLGGGMRLYYEGASVDKDTMDSNDDVTQHIFGMRYDF